MLVFSFHRRYRWIFSERKPSHMRCTQSLTDSFTNSTCTENVIRAVFSTLINILSQIIWTYPWMPLRLFSARTLWHVNCDTVYLFLQSSSIDIENLRIWTAQHDSILFLQLWVIRKEHHFCLVTCAICSQRTLTTPSLKNIALALQFHYDTLECFSQSRLLQARRMFL